LGPKALSSDCAGALRGVLGPAGFSPPDAAGRPAGLAAPRGLGVAALPSAGLAFPAGGALTAEAEAAPDAENTILGFSALRLNSKPLRPITCTSSAPTPSASRAMASAGSSGLFLSTRTLISSRPSMTPAAPSTTAGAMPALPT